MSDVGVEVDVDGSDISGDDVEGGDVEGSDVEGSDVEDDDDVEEGNRLEGSVPRTVLEYLARAIVDDPDSVTVDVDESRSTVSLRLNVSPDDMGRVIGRRGRTAQAIRTVVRAAAAREGLDVHVDIVD